MEILLGLMIGVGLSAACGFRIFVPLLGMSIANLAGHLTLASGFEWIGSWPAFMAFLTATVVEIAAYFVPWLDNLLDAAATPVAIVAGTIVTASQIEGMSPLLQWSLAAMTGGVVCAVVQGGTVAVRAISTGTTGGFGNFFVSGAELLSAGFVTVIALVLPILGLLIVVGLCIKMIDLMLKSRVSTSEVATSA